MMIASSDSFTLTNQKKSDRVTYFEEEGERRSREKKQEKTMMKKERKERTMSL